MGCLTSEYTPSVSSLLFWILSRILDILTAETHKNTALMINRIPKAKIASIKVSVKKQESFCRMRDNRYNGNDCYRK